MSDGIVGAIRVHNCIELPLPSNGVLEDTSLYKQLRRTTSASSTPVWEQVHGSLTEVKVKDGGPHDRDRVPAVG